eukprot:m.51028 g.51028  ORF g.51028 m.51028 type:complete len:88 (-) comp11212_c0_seq2:305-568(-)
MNSGQQGGAPNVMEELLQAAGPPAWQQSLRLKQKQAAQEELDRQNAELAALAALPRWKRDLMLSRKKKQQRLQEKGQAGSKSPKSLP